MKLIKCASNPQGGISMSSVSTKEVSGKAKPKKTERDLRNMAAKRRNCSDI